MCFHGNAEEWYKQVHNHGRTEREEAGIIEVFIEQSAAFFGSDRPHEGIRCIGMEIISGRQERIISDQQNGETEQNRPAPFFEKTENEGQEVIPVIIVIVL